MKTNALLNQVLKIPDLHSEESKVKHNLYFTNLIGAHTLTISDEI